MASSAFGTTAGPQQVAAMAHVVDAYCRHAGIAPGSAEQEHIATKILALYEIGLRGESEMLAALMAPPCPVGADGYRGMQPPR
jgi:hypothetical protein